MNKKNLLLLNRNQLNGYRESLLCDFSYFANRKVIYMDYPVHNNVGDHLIYWGAMQVLNENGNQIVGAFTDENYNLKTVNKLVHSHNAIIICHGGGNFGDLYTKHQNFRLKLIHDFPNVLVIVMPQSVFYSSQYKCNTELPKFRSNNVFIHVRDNASFKLLNRHGVNAIETPDCAHFIDQNMLRTNKAENSYKLLTMRRRDFEAIDNGSMGFDWEDLLSPLDRVLYMLLRKSCKTKLLHFLSLIIFQWYSRRLVYKGVSHFSEYQEISTDRLHGFILALLMQKPVSNLDNSYQKIENYRLTWIKAQSEKN